MATMAEFYSRNLSSEAKKGIAEKAKRGGTIGYAPTGYLNTTTQLTDEAGVSREVKTVIPDPTRAEHLSWAFEEYAGGSTSISDLTLQLAAHGLTTRDSRAVGRPLSRAAIHRMLSNPYYNGKIVHRGAIYPVNHSLLVDETTFQTVQERLAGRKIAGDRAWSRDHYLKGTIVCARCSSRMGYSLNRGKMGEHYAYFFCLGIAKKHIDCDMPYLPAERIEQRVEELWVRETLSEREANGIKGQADSQLDAYLAEALTLEDFQAKQSELVARLATAKDRLGALPPTSTKSRYGWIL